MANRAVVLVALFALAIVAILGPTPGTALADATITVTILADEDSHPVNGAGCSLREAIMAAENNAGYGGCTGVGAYGADTITFGALTGTITLGGSQLPHISGTVSIAGPGADLLTIDANFGSRHFSNTGTLTIEGLTLVNGSAGEGGAISNENGTLTVIASTLAGNTAGSAGGGIDSGNGIVTVLNSTFWNNSAGQYGGGIDSFGGSVTLINSTFASNSAGIFGGGFNTNETTVILTNVTLLGNSAAGGGGFSNFAGSMAITNAIVAGSLAGGDCLVDPGLAVGSNNLDGDGSCAALAGAGFTTADADLGPLQDNGGPTLTHLPGDGSPAIDAGSQTACDGIASGTDQRESGFPRTSGPRCDIGAVETRSPAPPALSITKAVAEGPPPVVGETITYIITVTNDGLGDAEGVVVTDVLPDGVSLVATEGCAEDPQGVPTCSLGSLVAGASAQVTVTVLAPETDGPVTNTATVASSAVDADTTDNEASVTVEVIAPDLVVTKSGPDVAPPGSTVTYLVTVTNAGLATAADVVLTDEVSGGSLAGFVAPGGVSCSATSCDLGDMEPGDAVTLWVQVTAPETTGTTGTTSTACAATASLEPDETNNCASAGTTIVADVPVPPLPAVGPNLYQAPPTATATAEPTVSATPEPSATATPEPTATSEPTEPPAATATSEPTAPATSEPTATTAEPSATAAPATEVPTATPTREAPMPPDTGSGSGTMGGGHSAIWLTLAGLALALLGGGVVLRRRTGEGRPG